MSETPSAPVCPCGAIHYVTPRGRLHADALTPEERVAVGLDAPVTPPVAEEPTHD